MADTEAQQQPVEETTTATQQEETPAPVATENAETAPEEPKQSNEPVEGGSLADAALVPVSSTIYTAISFLSLLLLIIGTALPWLRSDFNGSKSTVSLWKEERETAGVVTTVFVVDQTCKELREYYRASESFAIISIVTAALALLAGLASRFAGKALKPFGTILSALTFVAALIAWAIAANGLFRTFCNSQSYRDQHYYVYTGTGTFIAGWVLSFVGLIVSVSDISVPKIVPEALVDKFVATLFTLFALVAFGFSVIATPISFTSKWNTGSTETRVTIWHRYTYASNGDETNKFALKNSNCGDLSRYAKFAEAFSILSIAFTLIALIVGALSTRAANYKALLATGFLAGLTTTVTLSAELALYYKKFCSAQDSLDGQGYRLDAGLALFATAAVLTVFAFLFTLVVAISRAVGSKQSEGGNPRTTLLYIFGTAISVLFMIIALTMPVFQQETSDTAYTKVYYWETANLAAGVFTKQDFTCEPIWGRLVGAGALGIIAIVLSGLGALLAIGQLSSASLRVPASAITLLASVLQLTAFALVMAVFQGSYCNFKPYATGYKYAVGFGLMVAAFCLNFLVSLVNLLIA